MITKTPIGIGFFDTSHGGVYRGRCALVTGRFGAGKTATGLHFLSCGLKLQERCLLLSAKSAQDIAIYGNSLGLPVQNAIESGNLILLEYNDFVPGRDREDNILLPPDAFLQLKEIIESQSVQRVVFDTVLPWITPPDPKAVAEHIFSFIRALERLGVTALLTMLKPVSAAAFRLRRLVEDIVPVSISLIYDQDTEAREWVVSKFIGQNSQSQGIKYVIAQGHGIQELVAAQPKPVAATPSAQPTTGRALPTPHQSAPTQRRTFADYVLDKTSFKGETPRTTGRPVSNERFPPGGTGIG